jgi:hypothetical protein
MGAMNLGTGGRGKVALEAVEEVTERKFFSYGTGTTIKGYEKHHIFQDAAMRDLPGYSRHKAPAIHLRGKSSQKGSEHYKATKVQREAIKGGSFSDEITVAFDSLVAAGKTPREARGIVSAASSEIRNKLNISPLTQTRIPGNRKIP